VAKEGDRFRVGRDGDHLLCPFQCDLCHFQNIQRRLPGSDPETNSLEFASAGPIWMRCGHGRPAPWKATDGKESV
jgi:hypothetical protein